MDRHSTGSSALSKGEAISIVVENCDCDEDKAAELLKVRSYIIPQA